MIFGINTMSDISKLLKKKDSWFLRGAAVSRCKDGANANHNVTCSLTLDCSRIAEGNRDGKWTFFRMKEPDIVLFLQVTRIIILERKKDQKNLRSKFIITSQLLPETGRSQSNEP